ncbi:MAG TPA: phage protease, partial [Candidatus Acidoferrum sp.]|nr:phage protease [Candidatus Acidoferrum sp.]
MVMPGGVHKITASRDGKPVTVVVSVGPEAAFALQSALEAHRAAGPQRPWFDFDHAKGPASAWPMAFEWRNSPTPGVYAKVEWSKAGAEAIEGKMYRAFSPVFFVDANKPARVNGAPMNMGALVNDPAFKDISPIWAQNNAEELTALRARINELEAGEEQTAMTDQELAELRARLKQLESENSELKAKAASSATTVEITAKNEEIAQLKQSLAKVEGEIKAHRTAKADSAVKAAVARGALPPKDEAIQAKWRELIEADEANEVLLAAQKGNPALTPITAATGHRSTGALQASGVTVTREDSNRVLLAYAQEQDPVKRGAIYASDISPRIRDREAFPLILSAEQAIHAANTLGTLAADIVSQRALETLMTTFPVLSRISRDFSNEVVKFNQTVNTRLITVPSVTDYDATTGYASSAVTATDVPVKIDQHKAVQIDFNAHELGATDRDLFGEQAAAINYALGKTLMASLYARITVANFAGETVVAQAAFARTGVMAVGRALTDREVPDVMRMLILAGSYYDKLGEDTVVISAFNNANAGSAIQSGQLPDVHGFGVADAKTLPSAQNLTGFGLFPSALALALRLPADYTQVLPGVTGGAITRVVTDPTTGISLLLVMFVNHQLGRAYVRAAF